MDDRAEAYAVDRDWQPGWYETWAGPEGLCDGSSPSPDPARARAEAAEAELAALRAVRDSLALLDRLIDELVEAA